MQSTLNQTIALFTPSSAIALIRVETLLGFFQKKKISVKYPPLTTAKSELIAGSPKQRYSQIKELLGTKLFLAVRGGSTAIHLLPLLDKDKQDQELKKKILAIARIDGVSVIEVNCAFESELAQMTTAERKDFMQDLGLEKSGLEKMVQVGFSLLKQMSFFTAGKEEVRAWNILQGTTASEAAGKIHSDLQRGFIRAEVFHFDELKKFGSEAEIKKQGKLRLEGKDYIVQDGDVLHIRFAV